MGFFKNPLKSVKTLFTDPVKFVQNSLPTIGAIIGTTIAPGIGTAIGAGLGETGKDLAEGQGLGASLKQGAFSGAGAYAGNALGNFAGEQLGGRLGSTIGDTIASNTGINLGSSVAGDTVGNWIGNVAPDLSSAIGRMTVGGALGGLAGGSLGAGNSVDAPRGDIAPASATSVNPFTPKQEDEQQTPASLTSLGSLTDMQKSSNLASQGVYGGGNGPDEQIYFKNLLNRRLVDSGGNVSDLSGVSPIEQSYLQKLGISGYGNSKDLLEAISKWKPA